MDRVQVRVRATHFLDSCDGCKPMCYAVFSGISDLLHWSERRLRFSKKRKLTWSNYGAWA